MNLRERVLAAMRLSFNGSVREESRDPELGVRGGSAGSRFGPTGQSRDPARMGKEGPLDLAIQLEPEERGPSGSGDPARTRRGGFGGSGFGPKGAKPRCSKSGGRGRGTRR